MNRTKSVFTGLAMLATLSLAGSSFADPHQSFATEQKLLHQAMADLHSARAKLHRVERDFGGNARKAERLTEDSIEAIESAIEHARDNPEAPKHHGD